MLGIAGRLDMIFAIDGSQFVSKENFMKIKDFLAGAARALAISRKQTRIGLLTFGGKLRRDLSLEGGAVRSVLQQAIGNLTLVGGTRLLANAIKYASGNMFDKFSPAEGGKAIIVVTISSASQSGFETELESSLADLNRKKIKLLVVGLNRIAADKELDMIEKSHAVVNLQHTGQLKSALTPVMDESGKATGEYPSC